MSRTGEGTIVPLAQYFPVINREFPSMRFAILLLATTGLAAAPTLAQTAAPAPAPAQARPAAPATPPTQAQTAPTAAQTAPTPGTAAPAAPGQAAPAQPGAAPTMTIAAALPTLPNRATLLRLVTAAELATLLSGPGPFTLFAPGDAAFNRLPPGTLDTLTAPANKAGLQTIIKNHIVAGALTEKQIRDQIAAGGGRATLNTLSGQPLTASLENNVVLLTDAVGNKAFIDKADQMETNGVIHLTNGISLPKLG
ncbi:fasciclin domain-containing protein [Sphingomonas rubra]|uniref:Uncaracterized surface protein containing fasciclin (FAS1) repeats n=1 Tax=Sphingomonas rubra TaxID=634430 RepID=A0A1I5QPP9_9SPHN|nr:fasciclin domain-containing protein [Sphingomonas rubra]SFP48070.1 Uncaracterized surface protein containing fasciclin (FAS1) repeats [Sphingomonas rubra]